jgi:hypothetical protein
MNISYTISLIDSDKLHTIFANNFHEKYTQSILINNYRLEEVKELIRNGSVWILRESATKNIGVNNHYSTMFYSRDCGSIFDESCVSNKIPMQKNGVAVLSKISIPYHTEINFVFDKALNCWYSYERSTNKWLFIAG